MNQMVKILILNGPNLNLLGIREPEIYSNFTLDEIINITCSYNYNFPVQVDHFQSNYEGELITKIHNAYNVYDLIIINAGALTHYSIALKDALLSVKIPYVEVHISNIFARENFRHKSVLSDSAICVITGAGKLSYVLGIQAGLEYLQNNKTSKLLKDDYNDNVITNTKLNKVGFLSSNNFKDYLSSTNPIVSEMIDDSLQIQPNGIELTLKEVFKFKSCGKITVSNKNRINAETDLLHFDEKNMIFLEKGSYLITFNEITSIPKNMFAFAFPRSSLLRSGACVHTALWDSGYVGRPSALLMVYNENGLYLEKNARVIQLVFYKFDSNILKTYNGIYQNENINKK